MIAAFSCHSQHLLRHVTPRSVFWVWRHVLNPCLLAHAKYDLHGTALYEGATLMPLQASTCIPAVGTLNNLSQLFITYIW